MNRVRQLFQTFNQKIQKSKIKNVQKIQRRQAKLKLNRFRLCRLYRNAKIRIKIIYQNAKAKSFVELFTIKH